MSSEQTAACPHCGSGYGIYSTYTETRSAIFNWRGEIVESDQVINAKFRTTGSCATCGKKVKIPA